MGNWRWVISPNRTVWSIYESKKCLVTAPDKPRGPKKHLTNTGANIRPIPTDSLVPSMAPTVIVTLHGQQNLLKSSKATVYGWCMSVAISWASKME